MYQLKKMPSSNFSQCLETEFSGLLLVSCRWVTYHNI